MGKVKCADCGFLAVRHQETRQLLDAEEALRTKGEMPAPTDSRGYVIYDPWPVCFVRAINFREALEDNSGTPHCKQVINEERECNRFTPWIQGLTPKEHIELKIEEDRQLWETQRDLEDKIWREKEEEKADQRHREAIAAARSMSLVSALIGFVAGLAAVGLTYLLTNWPR